VSAEGSSQVVKFSLIFLSNFSEGHSSGIFLVDELAQGSFSLDEAVRDVQLFAEVGEPEDQLNGVHIVGNNNQLGLFLFNQTSDVIETKLEVIRLGFLNFLLCITGKVLSALNLASETNRALRCLASSGEYFLRSLNKTLAESDRYYSGSCRGCERIGQWRGEL
jgi:hypothetical protein